MKVKSVLVSQPRPAVIEKSPFYELSQKHHVEIAYRPFIRVEGVSLKEFRARALNPEHPVTRGTAQNPDIYFQTREASNKFYDAIPDMVADTMREISKISFTKCRTIYLLISLEYSCVWRSM